MGKFSRKLKRFNKKYGVVKKIKKYGPAVGVAAATVAAAALAGYGVHKYMGSSGGGVGVGGIGNASNLDVVPKINPVKPPPPSRLNQMSKAAISTSLDAAMGKKGKIPPPRLEGSLSYLYGKEGKGMIKKHSASIRPSRPIPDIVPKPIGGNRTPFNRLAERHRKYPNLYASHRVPPPPPIKRGGLKRTPTYDV